LPRLTAQAKAEQAQAERFTSAELLNLATTDDVSPVTYYVLVVLTVRERRALAQNWRSLDLGIIGGYELERFKHAVDRLGVIQLYFAKSREAAEECARRMRGAGFDRHAPIVVIQRQTICAVRLVNEAVNALATA
jgi:hypothetical protein